MLIEVAAYTFSGYLHQHWVEPAIYFSYYGFSWVAPPSGNWIYALTGVVMLSSIGIVLGFFYRVSAIIFTIGFTWIFLVDQTNYLNHFYLICLLGMVSVFIPAHRALSLDVRRRPALRAQIVPAWTIRIIQAHMAIAYLYGGIAKLNPDWLHGEPIRTWFSTGRAARLLPDFAFLKTEPAFYLVSYSGLLIDLLMVPLLLWRRTRALALTVAIAFHLANFLVFNIGVFPFLSIALTLLFVAPKWHRKILRLGPAPDISSAQFTPNRWITAALVGYLAFQLLFPFRHWLYPGEVHWTEEGHRFSWHMMLRSKTGWSYFIVHDRASGQLWRIDPPEILTSRQHRKMLGRPDMILQFAHYLRDQFAPRPVSVHAVASVQLNGRPQALLVDPEADLAQTPRNLHHATWILPMENDRPVPGRFRFATRTTISELREQLREN